MVGLSASLSANYVVPLLSVGASAFSPFHTHLLYGGTAADRAWLLAHHAHGAAWPEPDVTATPRPLAATVVSAADGLADLLSLAAGGPLLGAFDWPHPLVPPALWMLVLTAGLAVLGLSAPPPDRPPRPA